MSLEPQNFKVCWTDGSCLGNPGPGGWAALVDGRIYAGYEFHTTNNAMELAAVFNAVLNTAPRTRLTVVTDSDNVIGWLAKNWKRNQPHIDEAVRAIRRMCRERTITLDFVLVRGHAGHLENERVDMAARRMARQAMAILRTV